MTPDPATRARAIVETEKLPGRDWIVRIFGREVGRCASRSEATALAGFFVDRIAAALAKRDAATEEVIKAARFVHANAKREAGVAGLSALCAALAEYDRVRGASR